MDIKQQNVIIDDYVNIKLTDYSVSYCYKDKKKIKLPMVGTCYYMSPEVLRKDTIDASDASKIDVYSIGVLLYLLAFNDYPYKLRDVDSKNYTKIKGRGSVVAVQACVEKGYFTRMVHGILHLFVYFARYVN